MIENAIPFTKTAFFLNYVQTVKQPHAGVAQLVERDLPKVDVEGSKPFSRSKTKKPGESLALFVLQESGKGREPEKRVCNVRKR